MTISIWGQVNGKAPEKIDQAYSRKEASYLVGEYQLAFGNSWRVWAGRRDEGATACLGYRDAVNGMFCTVQTGRFTSM